MDLYPPFEPFRAGIMEAGDGHRLYYEVSGNPRGPAVLFLHGGPGAGTQPHYRRFFDPSYWQVVLFDQRGCGRSVPQASVAANTTAHLLEDIERLRLHLGVADWLLFGGSWGSTLALAYAQAYPGRVRGFVLRGIFLFRPHEMAWFLSGMGVFFPDAADAFLAHLTAAERGDVLGAYHRRLNHLDASVHLAAARAWCAYEEACARLIPTGPTGMGEPAAMLAMARIECHYMVHGGFLARPLLDGMEAIAHLPAIIVQGRYDIICPPATAFDLHRAWPGSRLEMIADAGHSSMEPGIRSALVAAVDGFKTG